MGNKNTKETTTYVAPAPTHSSMTEYEPVSTSRKRKSVGYVPGTLSAKPTWVQEASTTLLPTAPDWILEDSSIPPIHPESKKIESASLRSESKTPLSQLELARYPYLHIGQLCSHQNENGYRYLADVLDVDEKKNRVQLRYSRTGSDTAFWVQLPSKLVAPASYKTTTNIVYTDRDVASREVATAQGIQCVCDPSFQCLCALKIDLP